LQRDQPQLLPPPDHVDNSVFGALPLALYRSTKQKVWRELGLSYADTQWTKPRPDGMSDQTRFWIDDMYMITLLQTWAGRITGQRHYTDRAAQSMVAYLDRLQQPNGLFLHTPEAPFFWARGNGWMAAGMTELLAALPRRQPQRERILTDYRRMMRSLKAYQTDDGLWRQLIDQPDAWAESSGTAMFAFAMVSGVRHGWLEGDEFGEVARRAWLGLTKQVTPEGDVREVCVGTGARNDRQYYLDRPRITGDLHGQAPLLWTAVALLR
jgi:unsaturated rhamnogalacturonyl hydrolase